MRGTILGYDAMRGTGVVSCSDGKRYSFAQAELRGERGAPQVGATVDFETGDGTTARDIYPLPSAPRPTGSFNAQVSYAGDGYAKSNVAAGLLALFLGPWGIHKFYLGYTTEGIILLVGTFVSFLLTIVVIGAFGLMAIGIVCLVEAIIYLTKSPAEFDATYVQQRRPWF